MHLIEIIVLVVVAALIFRYLWSILDQEPNEEDVLARLRRGLYDACREACGEDKTDGRPQGRDNIILLSSKLSDGIADIKRYEEEFSPIIFVDGAKSAYQMIIQAFSNRDLPAIKGFISPSIYQSFEKVLSENPDNERCVITKIHKAEIKHIAVKDGKAEIAVCFESSMVHYSNNTDAQKDSVEDKKDDKRITSRKQHHKDSWVFERQLGTQSPDWILVATSFTSPEERDDKIG